VTNPVYNIVLEVPQSEERKGSGERGEKEKGGHPKLVNQETPVGGSSVWRNRRLAM
jgi:hypothetical protein